MDDISINIDEQIETSKQIKVNEIIKPEKVKDIDEYVDYWLLNPLHSEFTIIPKKIKPLITKRRNSDTEFKLQDLGWINWDKNFIKDLLEIHKNKPHHKKYIHKKCIHKKYIHK